MAKTPSPEIVFEKVTGSRAQVLALYGLLEQRGHGISHQQMPSLSAHTAFVRAHPYRAWYLLYRGGALMGSAYLQRDNSVGIHLTPGQHRHLAEVVQRLQGLHAPLKPIPSVRPAHFCIHIAPSNAPMRRALEKMGAPQIQQTYALPR